MGFKEIVKLIGLILSWFVDKDKETKKKKSAALKEVIDGVEEDDPSKISSGFARANRI